MPYWVSLSLIVCLIDVKATTTTKKRRRRRRETKREKREGSDYRGGAGGNPISLGLVEIVLVSHQKAASWRLCAFACDLLDACLGEVEVEVEGDGGDWRTREGAGEAQ